MKNGNEIGEERMRDPESATTLNGNSEATCACNHLLKSIRPFYYSLRARTEGRNRWCESTWQGQRRRPDPTLPRMVCPQPRNKSPSVACGPLVLGLGATPHGVCSSSPTHRHPEVGTQYLICKMGAMTVPTSEV